MRATHLPTGLLFPAKLGGLQRSPVLTPSNRAQGDSESVYAEESPASACNKSIGRDCAPFAITDRGYEIFQNFQVMGSSSRNPRAPHYYARVGDALVHLSYLHWKPAAGGAIEFSAHEFAAGELESIFDSLQSAKPEDVVRFPGMTVIEE
jgi:hypothetical protein